MERAVTRARLAAVAAGTVMTAATGVVAYGIVEANIAASVGGGFATLAAATLLGVTKIRSWTIDTSAERSQLAAAQQQAEDERTRYVAAQGAMMQERSRMMRDYEADRASLHERAEVAKAALLQALEAEKAAYVQRLEDERDALKIASYNVGVDHGRRGILDAPLRRFEEGTVVQFPAQAGAQPVRERATAHPADRVQEPMRDREAGRP